jgi:hypothetical protein
LLLVLLLTNSSLVPASELEKFNVPLWTDKLSADTADSKLHVQTTGAEGLVRWTGTPLKINGTNSKGLPDGAYITGDVVNGKAYELRLLCLFVDFDRSSINSVTGLLLQ